MAPILIVLGLLALGVAIVAFATRRPPGPRPQGDPDTGWNEPIAPVDAAVDPFAHAPAPEAVAAPPQPRPAAWAPEPATIAERQA